MSDRNTPEDMNLIVVDQVLPYKLPLIPLFSRPVFPEMLTPVMVNEDAVLRTIDYAMEHTDGYVGMVLVRDEEEGFTPENIHSVGVVGQVVKKLNMPQGGVNVFINTRKRFSIRKIAGDEQMMIGVVVYENEEDREDDEYKALAREIFHRVRELVEDNPSFGEEIRFSLVNMKKPGRLADYITSILNVDREKQQEILETFPVKTRLTKVLKLLEKEFELMKLQTRIREQINEKMSEQQREFFLKEQLKAIRKELGMEVDEKSADYERFKEAVETLELTGEAKEKVSRELEKLQTLEVQSPEYSVVRNYLDVIVQLPWNRLSDDKIDITKAEKILNRDHYGLEEVKERILEFLAVQQLHDKPTGSILCLVGPPGVGKTSLGRSVAKAMGREFFRFSLGGMEDVAEIKGHRRTYIGAMPGKIIEAVKIARTRNPVLMLDEIDKLGRSFRGDPSSALLEVLDPEQNNTFRDHYLDLPFDLSRVFFITTANTLDSIPRPLLDRMEIIRLSGYISEEKVQIASRYIIPRALQGNGLPGKFVSLPKKTLQLLTDGYAREAGVRNLEKQINRIMRKVAFKYVQQQVVKPFKLEPEALVEYLGQPVFKSEKARKLDRPGLSLGLAWTSMGGDVLTIECLANPGQGRLKLTGKLGEVMSESAGIAYSYSKKLALDEGVEAEWFEKHLLHLHVPEGATPKDGPSAGITMASAMLSLLLNRKVRDRLAMTGELSLSGDVLPIGGLKEKVVAAKRSGIREVIIPAANRPDLDEIPDKVRKGITFYPVERMDQVKQIIFSPGKPDFPEAVKFSK